MRLLVHVSAEYVCDLRDAIDIFTYVHGVYVCLVYICLKGMH